jgi:uncharacterized glyoxalase superfamily protein PhnB
MNVSYKPANLPDMIPYLVVQNAQRALEFYRDAFEFEVMNEMRDDDDNLQHVEMKRGPLVIMFCPEGAMGIPTKAPKTLGIEEPISLYCYVENVDSFHKHAVSKGAESSKEPEDLFWGDRMCALVDPDGYKWSFATYLGR